MRISILMSIYNETETQIKESVESILFQTFKDFELIVIGDNPLRNDIKPVLDGFHDKRLRFFENPQNVGLAMSMNRAASLASADIYARMDADDIALPDRLQKEYDALVGNDVDFVFSRYSYINEESEELNKELIPYYDSEYLNKRKKFAIGLIHHPTVMFTKQIFEKAGGYRDFPCSQDLDLWIRMVENNCVFLMLEDVLLKYRLNSQSVSAKKWFQQQVTCDYIIELSYERKKKGIDSYSKENYNTYIKKRGVGNGRAEKKLRKSYELLARSSNAKKKGNLFLSLLYKFLSIFCSQIVRRRLMYRMLISFSL